MITTSIFIEQTIKNVVHDTIRSSHWMISDGYDSFVPSLGGNAQMEISNSNPFSSCQKEVQSISQGAF